MGHVLKYIGTVLHFPAYYSPPVVGCLVKLVSIAAVLPFGYMLIVELRCFLCKYFFCIFNYLEFTNTSNCYIVRI